MRGKLEPATCYCPDTTTSELCEAAEGGLEVQNNGQQETEADGWKGNVCCESELVFIAASSTVCLEGVREDAELDTSWTESHTCSDPL